MAHTPMMQQYLQIKSEVPNALLMFRLGDFYELFFDDAVEASRILEITLTGRDAGSAGRIPMCGVPYHAVEQYIAKLVDRGYAVALCDQTEDPKQAKGLVKREIVRIVTPGTATHDEGAVRRLLAALVHRDDTCGLALLDVATGDVWVAETSDMERIREQFFLHAPVEVLLYEHVDLSSPGFAWLEAWRAQAEVCAVTRRTEPRKAVERAFDVVRGKYQMSSLTPLDLEESPRAVEALAMVLDYVAETQKLAVPHVKTPQNLLQTGVMTLDYTAQRNLEVFETVRHRQRKGSLMDLLDETRTAMGARILRQWLEQPLCSVQAIEDRLDAVETFVNDLFLREHVRRTLADVYDLDRLSGRVAFGTANARDLLAVAKSLSALPSLTGPLLDTGSTLLCELAGALPDCQALAARILDTLQDEPPVSVREGGMIRPGVDAVLDELRSANASGKAWLAELEQRERERTGIKSLKVGYNKVFGYYIEVSKSNQHLVPPEYERRQTLSTGERYVLPALKEKEASILNAEERAVEREYELFSALRQAVLAKLPDIQAAAHQIGVVDALCSLGHVSAERRYVRPRLKTARGIVIEKGRHPVVEAARPGQFVANDARLDDEQQFILLTGPNMAGKSTYMRQIALIVLMAHVGCFVPAASAEIGLVDRIFTRIGASDDLGAGQSTFMVEMVELAQILRQATDRSLVLLDEIGRGTSTYDGLCIAEAVMEALQEPGRSPLTLFATHYHELVAAAEQLPRVANYSVAVRESENDIAFLHTVVNRPADKSYGIQVARLAGIPGPVIERALALLEVRESAMVPGGEAAARPGADPVDGLVASVREAAAGRTDGSASAVAAAANGSDLAWVEALARLDVARMTPIEALNRLDEVVRSAKEALSWASSR
ncbi:DNA mismatch repair protein MutS [Alicyclobacillus cycloheptanicus]|uniref:DNA mismatch repair protein MutS n=1 Tax=Alicyclobacillus cycloheptanicus TaxID=1457 RepID=A0ABT9XG85_9BACL|nr:DNA mismatch repair protein MutS [Alicyclobacillus cycloheptanicus]MDQ0189310.1 DNA mismatch repair protein MutS [Alicyclobacillus cycloheptanicus]WDM01328.1 DNA mismatch repair protein MutS [Alicyclobacillus cycloheptanicus]